MLPDIDALIESDPEAYLTVSYATEPGDVLVFHFRTLHDAPGNQPSLQRRVVSFRWVGEDVPWAERPWQMSPPFVAEGLAVGDPLDDDRFPLV